MINVAGIAVASIFILFIASHRPFTKTDGYLVTINVLLASFLAVDILILDRLTAELVIASQIIPFLLFPFFFLYGMGMLQLTPQYPVVFFIPTVSLLCYMSIDFYILHGGSDVYAEEIYRFPSVVYHVFYKSQMVFTLAGQVWFYNKVRVYQTSIRDQFSSLEAIELRWLKNVSVVFLFSVALSLVAFLIYNFNANWINIELINKIINGFMVLVIFYMSYHGIRLYILRGHSPARIAAPDAEKVEKKYSKSTVAESTLRDIHDRLTRLLQHEKIYLEPQLQLNAVAEKLDVSTHLLSQAINTIEMKTFYDLVNRYRIDHFKTLLSDPAKSHFSILALGLDSGFNSKASMNRVFKEQTGLSPSAFQKSLQKDVSVAS